MALVVVAFVYLVCASPKFRKLVSFLSKIVLTCLMAVLGIIYALRKIIIILLILGWGREWIEEHKTVSIGSIRTEQSIKHQNQVVARKQQAYVREYAKSSPVNPTCEQEYSGNETLINQCNHQKKFER